MTRICFLRVGATPLFLPKSKGKFGGAEVRALTFARGLAQRGNHVDFAVAAHDGLPTASPEGIHVVPLPGKVRGIKKFVRSIRGRLSNVPQSFPAIKHIDAPIIGCFGVHSPTAQVIAAAKAVGKKTILFLTSSEDVSNDNIESAKGKRQRTQHRYALLKADRIVVQTETQLADLQRRFSRQGTLIKNPIDTHIADDDLLHFRTHVLWIGRADRDSKRADVCFDLARRCPEIPFHVVMNGGDEKLLQQLLTDIPYNMDVETHVPLDKIESLYKTASVLINTSVSEGFPNAFLQAMKFRTPILSLDVNPDDVLTTYNCGTVAGSMDRMAELLPKYWPRSPLSVEQGRNARDYVEDHHSLDARVSQLEDLIREMAANRPAAA